MKIGSLNSEGIGEEKIKLVVENEESILILYSARSFQVGLTVVSYL